ncbi:MAG: helix-turn-helix domain-containing protein [Roseburia sp.]|nr:helix-turn-helix domain-containing protein [Roseburia sp.]
MLHYKDVCDAQKLCECLASPVRVEILKQVLEKRADSLDALAKKLHLSNGAITQHVKKLCELGLVRQVNVSGKHGIAKKCVVAVDRIIIDISTDVESENECIFDLPIGQFSAAAVNPYCALATTDGWIGERDDPRYFTYPERTRAALIYFNSGKISWTLPSPPKKQGKPKSISVSLELSSKPYGHGYKRDSAVTFFLNDVKLGTHVLDGEFTDRKGLFTPRDFDDVCQYGKYKTISIDGRGAFLDGVKLGDVTISDIDTENLVFSLATENGIAVFGKGYGDYDCGLRYKVEFET